MTAEHIAVSGLRHLTNRPIYGPGKRVKRGLLRAIGRWSRRQYDVQIVLRDGVPTYKKITLETPQQASRISQTLTCFGASPHLPTWHSLDHDAVWVDFVAGEPCRHIRDAQMPAIARCFEAFAQQESRLIPLEQTGYRQRHEKNLAYLRQHGIGDPHLHAELVRRSELAQPPMLRIGFDYRDPIAPNLLDRHDDRSICAIDVKNLHRHTIVGEGLAKVSGRWLCADRRQYVFERMNALGLGDIEQNFEFIRLYERVNRARLKIERDLKVYGEVRRQARHCARFESSLG